MPYDPTLPKISRISPELGYSEPLKCEDISFSTRLLSLRHLALFYGTDIYGLRNGYASTLLDALSTRIATPVSEYWQQRRACFFKPYQSACQVFDGLSLHITIAFTALQVLGLLGTFGNPYAMIAVVCIPSVFELISGFVSLGQALYYKVKSNPNQTEAEQAQAGEYFQDAVIRFALVIPLAIVSLAAVPFEFIRFFTRAIASLVELASGEKTPAHVESLSKRF